MTQPIPDAQLEALAQRFMCFADRECGDYAPFYDRLARGIAGDPDLLTIAAHTRSGQQAPPMKQRVRGASSNGALRRKGRTLPDPQKQSRPSCCTQIISYTG